MGSKTRYRPAEPRVPQAELSIRQDAKSGRWLLTYEPIKGGRQLLGAFPSSDEAQARAAEVLPEYPGARIVFHPPSGGWLAMGFC